MPVRRFVFIAILIAVSAVFFAETKVARAQVSVTTWHYDNARTGANTNETKLTPANLNKTSFGKLFTQPVDGAVVGQALYLPNVSIPGAGVHNVVYVATMHDSVYAFDADSANGGNAQPLWHVSFLSAGITPIPIKLQRCGGVTQWNEVGVLSTPVIDATTGTLYVVAKTYENNSVQIHRLHALDVATGQEKSGSPVKITASFLSGGNQYNFQDAMQVNRPALLLQNGYVYIAFGSNGCRGANEQGWAVAYKTSNLRQAGVFDTEPGSSAAGFWHKGGGLSADASGGVYGETADGPYVDGTNFGLSVLKLKQSANTLKLADWFTPYNLNYLNKKDLDLNDPVLILPDQPGPYPHLAMAVGKEGTIYVLNRDNMGHFCTTCTNGNTQIVQELPLLVGDETGALIYWNNTVYSSGVSTQIKAFALANGQLASTPFAQSSGATGGHSPVLTANGNTSGIIWQLNGGNLTAYDALTLKRLYVASQAPNGRDDLSPLPHFANFVVANGKVYIGTNTDLAVFGLY